MKKNIVIIVLVVIILGLTGGLVYTAYSLNSKSNENNTLAQENTQVKSELEELKTQVEEEKTEQENEGTTFIPAFDPSKVTDLGGADEVFQRLYCTDAGITALVTGENTLELTVDPNEANSIYGVNLTEGIRQTIDSFDKQIVDIQILPTGQGANGSYLIILMEDGTVKYIAAQSMANGDFTVHDVPNAENIIRIVGVSARVARSGYTDIAGLKLDGTSVVLDLN